MTLTSEKGKRSTRSKGKSVNPISLSDMIFVGPHNLRFGFLLASRVFENACIVIIARHGLRAFFTRIQPCARARFYDITGMKQKKTRNERGKKAS